MTDSGTGIDCDICQDYFSKFASKSYQDAGLGCSYLKILLNPMMATYGLKKY
jgi:hypothetical protein